jgi:hypothetical protein
MITRAIGEYETLPRLMRLGLIVFAFGGFLDVLYQAAPPNWALYLEPYLGTNGNGAHFVTLVGMLVIMLGVMRTALSRARRNQSDNTGTIEGKEDFTD